MSQNEIGQNEIRQNEIGGTKLKKSNNVNNVNTDKEFKKLSCGPTQEKSFTCYTTSALIQLRDNWNARHPDASIQSNDVEEIWHSLKSGFGNVCNKESCWLRQLASASKEVKNLFNYFAPESPKTWKKNLPVFAFLSIN